MIWHVLAEKILVDFSDPDTYRAKCLLSFHNVGTTKI